MSENLSQSDRNDKTAVHGQKTAIFWSREVIMTTLSVPLYYRISTDDLNYE